ncbi:Uncharacterised protein [Kingella potus]|uniref:Uncharacterized protein n=1 Tax=Kingella potus TaxID=265175 RepID=A0A377R2N0_9NEIS|nr:hypothetical protein [Kingella potus]STR00551.1 Uncharacterised protein [Kingella potus]
MNEQRRQTREILQLEIELARLKVRAEHIRLRQIKQRRRTRTANLVRTAELLAAAFADSRSSRAARGLAPRPLRRLWPLAWLAWHFLLRKNNGR